MVLSRILIATPYNDSIKVRRPVLPATTARIFSIPPAPSARNLHHFHPRLYEFWASLDSFSEAAEGLLEVS